MKLTLLFVLSLSFLSLNAQIEFSPQVNTQDLTVDLSDDWEVTHIYSFLLNNSPDSLSLIWEVVKIDAPEEWLIQFAVNADGGGDFGFGVNTNNSLNPLIPLPLISNDSSIMRLAIRPFGVAGCGTYEVQVSSVTDTATILAVGTYNFRINTTPDCTTSTNDFEKSQIQLFPNPTSDYLSLSENDIVNEIQVFNIIGKKIKTIPFQNGKQMNISNVPNGLYLIRMLDRDGEIVKTTRLTKQ